MNKKRYALGGAVLALALGFAAFGIMRGEMAVVLGKAATICLQCIGLG